jgi:hypothetical protein
VPVVATTKEVAGGEQVFSVKGLLIQHLDAHRTTVFAPNAVIVSLCQALAKASSNLAWHVANSLTIPWGVKVLKQYYKLHYNFELDSV